MKTAKERVIRTVLDLEDEQVTALEAYVNTLQKSKLRWYTVSAIKSGRYTYRPIRRDKVVGSWPGDESVDELLALCS